MPTGSVDLGAVFDALRGVLARYANRPGVAFEERRGVCQISLTTRTDRTGRPLFVASANVNKNYVSYHLMPLYMNPALKDSIPAALKKRLQGKACFNFTSVDTAALKDLAKLTKKGVDSFKTLPLPWEAKRPSGGSRSAGSGTARRG